MAFIPAVLITVGIAIVSLIESPYVPQELSTKDKLLHGLMYTFLAIAWMIPVDRSTQQSVFSIQLLAGIIVGISVTLYGALMEILQHYCTVTRSGEWQDILADFIGAIVGVLIIILWRRLSTILH